MKATQIAMPTTAIRTTFGNQEEFLPKKDFRKLKASVIKRTAMITATNARIVKKVTHPGLSSRGPLLTNPVKSIKAKIITKLTAKKGARPLMSLRAYATEITSKAIESATNASICFLPSPKIFDFCKIAKTIVKMRTKTKAICAKGVEKIVE